MFLISLCSNYQVILQKLSGHNVFIEIIESLSSKYLWSGKREKNLTYFRYVVAISILLFNIIAMSLILSHC